MLPNPTVCRSNSEKSWTSLNGPAEWIDHNVTVFTPFNATSQRLDKLAAGYLVGRYEGYCVPGASCN